MSSRIEDQSSDMTDLETGSSTAIQNTNSNGDFESHSKADGLNQRVTEHSLTESDVARIDDQEENQNRKASSNQRDIALERIFLVTNFVMELPSAVFDQLSSVRKPQYALISMIMSFTMMLVSIIGLARTGRRERAKLMMRGNIPWFYSPLPSYKPLGTFADIVGLVCNIFQCVFAAIAYAFLYHRAECPIKISAFPLIFASGLLWSRFPSTAPLVERSEIYLDSAAPAQHALQGVQPPETPLFHKDEKMYRVIAKPETPLFHKDEKMYRVIAKRGQLESSEIHPDSPVQHVMQHPETPPVYSDKTISRGAPKSEHED